MVAGSWAQQEVEVTCRNLIFFKVGGHGVGVAAVVRDIGIVLALAFE